MEAFPLAIEECRLGSDVAGVRAGAVLRLLPGQVLEESRLGWTDVLGAVSVGGSGGTFPTANIYGVSFEWCIQHLLNRPEKLRVPSGTGGDHCDEEGCGSQLEFGSGEGKTDYDASNRR